jgi:hypothetical protein
MSFTERASLAALIVIIDLLLFFVPLAAVLTGYVLLARPEWFPKLVQKIYRDAS